MADLLADPAVAEALAAQLCLVARDVGTDGGLRAWVAGCGTGEEAYATAILLHEAAEQAGGTAPSVLFATDLDERRVAVARAGVYHASQLKLLAPAQRERFFELVAGQQHVSASLRGRIVFATHQLLDDPPFSRLHLIVCRVPTRLLGAEQWRRLLGRFAFALRPGGLLLLRDGAAALAHEPCFCSVGSLGLLFSRTTAPAQLRLAPSVATSSLHARSLAMDLDGNFVAPFAGGDAAASPLEQKLAGQSKREAAFTTLQARHDAIYEDLCDANEELVLRREERESFNAQLHAVNHEQQQTLAALARANTELENLIASNELGALFLDRDLRLKRFTAPVRQLFNLRADDLGRPLDELIQRCQGNHLLDDTAELLRLAIPTEREVQHNDGRWFLVRTLPYRTAEQQFSGAVLTFQDISERKRAESELRRSHHELELRVHERTAELVQAHAARQALLRQLVQAQEAERLRIARELHDTLGQQITAVLLGLKTIRELSHGRQSTLEQLDQVGEIVQMMGREMHEIAVNLRPTALDDVGLSGALRGFVEGWSRRTGIAVELLMTGVEGTRLLPEVETTLYRVMQEALTNVARHAAATRVSVILESYGSFVVGVVEDNGRGFAAEAALQSGDGSVHLGLLGMRERVALVGGTLEIESALGNGTTVIARIPLL